MKVRSCHDWWKRTTSTTRTIQDKSKQHLAKENITLRLFIDGKENVLKYNERRRKFKKADNNYSIIYFIKNIINFLKILNLIYHLLLT